MNCSENLQPGKNGDESVSFARTNRLYALVGDSAIAEFLKQWATSRACQISWGDRESKGSDLVAIGCFAAELDRRLLGRDAWEFYVKFTKEVNDGQDVIMEGELIDCHDDTLCILVDDIDDWALPRLPMVMRLDQTLPNDIAGWLETSSDIGLRQAQTKEREALRRHALSGNASGVEMRSQHEDR